MLLRIQGSCTQQWHPPGPILPGIWCHRSHCSTAPPCLQRWVGPPASLTSWGPVRTKMRHHIITCTGVRVQLQQRETAHVYSECLCTLTCTCTVHTVHTVLPRHNLTHACARNARNVEVSHDNLYH